MKNSRTPLRKALLESRYIVLGAIMIAVIYNVFADSSVPWIRELPGSGDTASIDDLLGADTAVVAPADTGIAAADTLAMIDTTSQTDTSAEASARQRAIDDSIRSAVAARQAFVRDSIARAKAAASPNVDAEIASKEIGTATAKQLFDKKAAVWFDARTADEFKEGHIPGARNVYANDFQSHIPQILGMNLNDQLVVVYCGGGLCELSHDLAKNLRLLGLKKVVVYTGGTTEWTKQNYPMTKGE